MDTSISTISPPHLVLSLIPAGLVIIFMFVWQLKTKESFYALGRMVIQLLLIGYILGVLFAAKTAYPVLAVLIVMGLASSWISLRTVPAYRNKLFLKTVFSIVCAGGFVLFIITHLVLHIKPWYKPDIFIPLSGMVFASCMNAISLTAERYFSELSSQPDNIRARNIAFQTALIPTLNALFAVGLVSLPGMMTGQILSGVNPLIAVRYQIMVMAMIFGANGLAVAIFLLFVNKTAFKITAQNSD